MKQIVLMLLMLIFPFYASRSQVETRFFENKDAISNMKHNSSMRTAKPVTVSLSTQEVATKIQQYLEGKKDENRFGVPIDVSYSLNDGSWESAEEGRLWSMRFRSDNAVSLTFFFSNLYLPEGAELYIVNSDETVSYGPVTLDALTEKGHYLSDIISGSDATIILYEPTKVTGRSILELSRIIHGCTDFEKETLMSGTRTIYYPQGATCYPAWTDTSDGVGLMIFSDGTYASGALLLDTRYSFDANFLFNLKSVHSANNSNLTSAELAKVATMAVRFRARETSCGSGTPMISYTFNGGYLKAYWHETSFALAGILQNVKQQKNITWLGWDRTGNTPTQGTWIGKYETYDTAVSFADNSITTSQNPYTQKNEWNAVEDWNTVRVTKEGAPFFNENKQVVGFFTNDICYGDGVWRYWFGKFSDSWTGGGQDNNRLGFWLDIANKGFTSVNSCHPMTIEGPTSAVGSAVYYIDNLPSDFSVEWYFPQNSYCNQHCLYQNYPTSNQCTIIPDSQHNMTEITLRAFLYRGNTYVNCMDKTITVDYGRQNTYNDNDKECFHISNVGNVIHTDMNLSNNDNQSWTLEVYNTKTTTRIFSKNLTDASYKINATNWKSGIYVVQATIGNKSFSEKVIIK